MARRYFTVMGSQPDEATLDNLAETGEGEGFLQRAIAEQQGRWEVLGVVAEIQERHGAVAQLERSLWELQQVFNDMAVLVEEQGEQLKDIEDTMRRARSFIDRGCKELVVARKHQKSSRKRMCISIGVLLVIILIIVIAIAIAMVLDNKKNNS
jgi:syntaxin 1B/2/3